MPPLCSPSAPPRSSVSLRKEVMCTYNALAFVFTSQRIQTLRAWLWCPAGLDRTVTNKEIVLKWLLPWNSVQREQTEMAISQSSPEIGMFAHFKSR